VNSYRNILFAVIAIAAAAGFMLGGPSFHTAHITATPASHQTDSTSDTTTSWSHGQDGANANADEHWRKHGGEFSEDHNEHEYENEASNFVHHPPAGSEIKHRANGDTLVYDPDTNTFAVEDRNGEPRTMFKPDRGRAYWDRQH
jgi:pyocin large subunit-like protein